MKDLEDLYNLYCLPEVDEFNIMGIPESIEVTRKQIKQYLESKNTSPRPSFIWAIRLLNCNEIIGEAGFFPSNDKFKLGEIFYKLNPKYWGNGYATEIAQSLVNFGFNEFKLHKVEAGVATPNHASIKVLEKIGMTREGLRLKILPIRGKWVDNYHYAIVEDDPREY